MKNLSFGGVTQQITRLSDLMGQLQGAFSGLSTSLQEFQQSWTVLAPSSVSHAEGSPWTHLYAKSVEWQYRCSERGLTLRSSCGSSPCLTSDLGYLQPWKPSQTKQLRSTSLDAFDNIESTERFIAYLDEFQAMAIKPVRISEMWEFIMEDDWWYSWEERPELGALFDNITAQFQQAVSGEDASVFNVSLDVEYSLKQPPGVQALQWGHHLGTTEEGYIFKARPPKHVPDRRERRDLMFVTGFVRTITMEPIG